MRIASAGHAVFAATLIAFGVLSLINVNGGFSVIWAPVPKGLPARQVLYLCAGISLISGLGLLWQRTAAPAARLLFAYLFGLIVLRLTELARSLAVDVYWGAAKTAVMLAAAWVLFVWFATDWDYRRLGLATGDKGLRIARTFYGLAMIFFGVAHFQYVEHTASLVPGWLPAHVAWAYFTGSAFIAAGLAIVFGVFARLAAALSSLQMGLFLLLVWVPKVAAGSISAFNWGETIVSWALAVAGWVVADSYRGTPWFAVVQGKGRELRPTVGTA